MVYLSLGSNVGDRFGFLEKAIQKIEEKIGRVVSASPVYETPAWGYNGAAFLNACLGIETEKSPEEVLKSLLAIEESLGRIRNQGQGYQDRTIDLDLLLYDALILESPTLELPHPRMNLRQFILTPLNDIAGEVLHPQLQKSISSLKKECLDNAELSLWKDGFSFLGN